MLDGDGQLLARQRRRARAARRAAREPARAAASCWAAAPGALRHRARARGRARASTRSQLDDGAAAWAVDRRRPPPARSSSRCTGWPGPAGLAREELPPRADRARARADEHRVRRRRGGGGVARPPARPGAQVPGLRARARRPARGAARGLLAARGPRRREQRAPGDPHAARPARARPRRAGAPSGYVVARAGGYELAPGRVAIDADDFEARARAGLRGAPARRDRARRGRRSPPPRARTAATSSPTSRTPSGRSPSASACATSPPRCCAGSPAIKRAAGDEDAAAEHLQRLVELEPLDLEAQRELLALMLRRGRHSEALRRYELRAAAATSARSAPSLRFDRVAATSAHVRLAARPVTAAVTCPRPRSPPRSRGGSPTSSAASRAGAYALLAVLVLSQGAGVRDPRRRGAGGRADRARHGGDAVGGGRRRARAARPRRVLPRARDRDDERRRADLGDRRRDPGVRRPALGRAARRAAGRPASCSRAPASSSPAREAPSEDAEARRAGRTAIGLALLAAIGFGTFFAGIDRAEESGDVAWVLLAARTADVLLLLAACAVVRPRAAARARDARRDRRDRRASTCSPTCCSCSPPAAACSASSACSARSTRRSPWCSPASCCTSG